MTLSTQHATKPQNPKTPEIWNLIIENQFENKFKMNNNLRISHESLDMDDIISDLNPAS